MCVVEMNGIIPGACCLEKTEGKGIQEQGENARGGVMTLVTYRWTSTAESWDLLFWESHSSSHRAPTTDTSRVKKQSGVGRGDHCQTLTPVHWLCGQAATPYGVFLSGKWR